MTDFHKRLRIAAIAGCAPSTVRDYLEGRRKTHATVKRAIEAAIAELAALDRAAATPVCPHEPGAGQ